MKPTVDELRRVAIFLMEKGYYQCSGFLMKTVRLLEQAGLDRVP